MLSMKRPRCETHLNLTKYLPMHFTAGGLGGLSYRQPFPILSRCSATSAPLTVPLYNAQSITFESLSSNLWRSIIIYGNKKIEVNRLNPVQKATNF